MNGLTKLSLKNGIAVVILCVLVLGYGLYSATQIKQQTFPDLEFPAVFVQAVQPGASSEEIESGVTKSVEDALKSIKGYDSLTSTSSENAASIFIQFPFGTDMDKRYSEVESAIAKANLPDKANVTVQRLSANSQPIYQAAIFSDKLDSQALASKLEDEVVPKLKKLDGVNSVKLKGTSSDKLNIVVDKEKAAQRGITLSAIQSALQSLDYALPLGNIARDETTIPITLSGKVGSLRQIEELKLGAAAPQGAGLSGASRQPAGEATGTAGASVTLLKDIAEIKTVSEQDEITRYNGEPSYLLEVVKSQEANTADVSDEVKATLASYEDQGEISLHVVTDQGEEIKESVAGLVREGLFGVLFCVLIIFLFLRNVRATLISIVSLPISIFATIALLDQMGYTLNIMTLGGIAVSIGRIVDDSIVVIENIYRWRQEKGNEIKGKELAYKATKEVIGAVASSTIATVVVFAPLAFVSGIIGQFFRPFSIAVVVSILASLLVSMMLIPVLGSRFFKNVKPHKQGGKLTDGFEKIVRGALRRKGIVIGAAVMLLAGSLSLIPLLGFAFLPAGSAPAASIEITLPSKSGIDQTNQVGGKVEQYLKSLPGVDNYELTIGGSGDNPLRSSGGKNKATATVQFGEGTDLDQTINKLNAELPAIVTAEVDGTTIDVKESQQQGPPSGDGIDVSIYAEDGDKLAQAAKQVEDLMKQSPDLKNVANNMNDVTPKWVLTLNQQGIDANVSPYLVMQLVGEQLRPVDAGTYSIDNKEQEVTLSYLQPIASREELENIQVPTSNGMKKLGDVADLAERNAWVKINHDDGKLYAQVSGTVKNADSVSSVTKQVEADIQSLSLPSGVEVSIGGGQQMISEGFSSIGIAMASAVGLVFLVMSMTFGGLRTPLIILSSLIFIPIGSLGALLIAGEALSMSGMIGMLMLVGIVVTNAVVLLDRVEKNRKSGLSVTEAIVEASKTRLRPILMTAFATMLALLPLALSGSSTSLISGGLAITVIGGLFSSTLLTLIVVPVIYELAWKKRKAKVEEEFIAA
ncbi:swarming motility protein SwrC [Cohnella xylanilytica]|uniref:efflux RND transporter permease subunit n=1 Tax=Cohnella xylanilytica TaxID=557555 RepID=UPI001B050101|nr:efflux RND transporter permease subunit [Cohnella xylanilytica]GIO16606.1 swarming motility protein SwrC [Cohnella xylanilytica]